jgi:hypothetical protein
MVKHYQSTKGTPAMVRTLLTLLFLAVALPANAETLTLSSTYGVAGTNPDGSKYTGTAAVKVISDATFTIQWTIGSSVYTGFGMRMNDALAATYMINGDPGLVIYKVGANGRLDGLWAIRGHNGDGTELLTPRN